MCQCAQLQTICGSCRTALSLEGRTPRLSVANAVASPEDAAAPMRADGRDDSPCEEE